MLLHKLQAKLQYKLNVVAIWVTGGVTWVVSSAVWVVGSVVWVANSVIVWVVGNVATYIASEAAT